MAFTDFLKWDLDVKLYPIASSGLSNHCFKKKSAEIWIRESQSLYQRTATFFHEILHIDVAENPEIWRAIAEEYITENNRLFVRRIDNLRLYPKGIRLQGEAIEEAIDKIARKLAYVYEDVEDIVIKYKLGQNRS